VSNDIIMFAVGDVGPNRDDPNSIFQFVKPILGKGDVLFCQLEPCLSNRGIPLPQSRLPMRGDPKGAKAIKEAGFQVVSFATNHCMDWGREAFFETIQCLQKQDLKVIGAGKNIEEARKPAFMECKGTKIAFLAYNSILPQGYWAEANRPGCAPLRGLTVYEQIEHDQPGTPCRIHTFPHKEDLAAMVEDIKKAKAQADLVMVSVHWGIHFVPAALADYQRIAAHAAIDAGADLIIGHHPHILKPIEVYKGKVILYSLANFALEPPIAFAESLDLYNSPSYQEMQQLNPDWKKAPNKAMPPDSYKTIVSKCVIADKQIRKVTFLPTQIDDKTANPEILPASDPRFQEIVRYMEDITRDQKLDTSYEVEGNEVLVRI